MGRNRNRRRHNKPTPQQRSVSQPAAQQSQLASPRRIFDFAKWGDWLPENLPRHFIGLFGKSLYHLMAVIGIVFAGAFAFWKSLPSEVQKKYAEDVFHFLRPKADIRIEPMRVSETCNKDDKIKSAAGAISAYATDIMTRDAVEYLRSRGVRVYSSRVTQGLDRAPVKYSMELVLTCVNPSPLAATSSTPEVGTDEASILDGIPDGILGALLGADFSVTLQVIDGNEITSSALFPIDAKLLAVKLVDRKLGVNNNALMAAIFESMPLPEDIRRKLSPMSTGGGALTKYRFPELAYYRAAESLAQAGDLKNSEDFLRAAIRVNANFAMAVWALGEIRKARGDLGGSEEFFKKARALDLDHPKTAFTAKLISPLASLKSALSQQAAEIVADGVAIRKVKSTISAAELLSIQLDPAKFSFSVIQSADPVGQTARQFRRDGGAILAIVGGVFDRDFTSGAVEPAGLLVKRGVILRAPRDWNTGGVLLLGSREVKILPISEFHPGVISTSHDAIQSHLLVVDPGAKNGIRSRTPELASRAAACVMQSGHVAFVLVNGLIDLFDFGALLSDPADRGGIGCERAMYLDGGPSTQASLAIGKTTIDVEGEWATPNAILVHPVK